MTLISPPLELLPNTSPLIGDRRPTDSSAGMHKHRYAATGQVTSQVPMAGKPEMDAAVAAARAAQPSWAAMPVTERRRLLMRLADLIEADADRLTNLGTIDNGTPQQIVQSAPSLTAELFRYNAGWTDRIEGSVIPTWPGDALDYAVEKPFGVVAIIIPWNGPLIACGMTGAPALAAGNTVVIKPPELAPYSALRIGELALEAGIPPGVLNVVPAGPVGGDALVRNPGVDKIHFTGSGATARIVLSAALETLTPVGLELGGKSANIVFEDTDISTALPTMMSGIIALSGQGCINGTRLLVQDRIYDEVVEAAGRFITQVPIGDPYDGSTAIGPVVNDTACQRILGMITRATEDGARVISGGERLNGDYADGYFVAPTILADVPSDSYIAQNEVFGPVLSILRFSDETEAVKIANDTEFGLAAYIQTNDLKRAHRVADRLDVGNVWINGFNGIPVSAPFGGNKHSGHGRLGGKWGIREFTRPRNIWVSL
ncbi:aldehyde dehydrogenase family protein [Rhodococcus rhodochrous]|uniref:Aldehyde dehydrogenase n=1 Tax=Rhodococcus rhodochrous KG-21 TaxID=1441923 RepID=A0A0N0S1A7_RHORH|nr:aldehyde dehydrogenase family protein [Rhodococcus rhodochrous]KOS56693.1 aldehyde dehydrogenase [Rhodococcus rhodochrous KG-21]